MENFPMIYIVWKFRTILVKVCRPGQKRSDKKRTQHVPTLEHKMFQRHPINIIRSKIENGNFPTLTPLTPTPPWFLKNSHNFLILTPPTHRHPVLKLFPTNFILTPPTHRHPVLKLFPTNFILTPPTHRHPVLKLFPTNFILTPPTHRHPVLKLFSRKTINFIEKLFKTGWCRVNSVRLLIIYFQMYI